MSYFSKRYSLPGTAPGDISAAAHPVAPPRLHVIEYGAEFFFEKADASLSDCAGFVAAPTNTWIHVQGNSSPDMLREMGAAFGIHPLALEDILHTGQRPKLENYGGPLFTVLSWPSWNGDRIATQQVSIFFNDGVVISFHAGESDPFEPLRERLRDKSSRLRAHASDLLFHALIDLVIDQGFPILDELAEWIEQMEEKLLARPQPEQLHDLHQLRRDVVLLRRMLWPQRDIINSLLRDVHPLIQPETRMYLRDCYDHSVQIIEILESFRETSASLMELYLSSASNRLNEIIRVLTIIATIFIPPTFIVGVYGMNFSDAHSPWAMPELHWYFGYPLVWLVIIGMVGGMLYYFRRKNWF